MESYCECNLKLCFGCSECGCDHESEAVKDILEMSDAIMRVRELCNNAHRTNDYYLHWQDILKALDGDK